MHHAMKETSKRAGQGTACSQRDFEQKMKKGFSEEGTFELGHKR